MFSLLTRRFRTVLLFGTWMFIPSGDICMKVSGEWDRCPVGEGQWWEAPETWASASTCDFRTSTWNHLEIDPRELGMPAQPLGNLCTLRSTRPDETFAALGDWGHWALPIGSKVEGKLQFMVWPNSLRFTKVKLGWNKPQRRKESLGWEKMGIRWREHGWAIRITQFCPVGVGENYGLIHL